MQEEAPDLPEPKKAKPSKVLARTVIWNHSDADKLPMPTKKRPDTLLSKSNMTTAIHGSAQVRESIKQADRMKLPLTSMLAHHDKVLASLIDVLSEQGKVIRGIKLWDIGAQLAAHKVVNSLRQEFISPGRVTNVLEDGLALNKQWNAEHYLRQYPKALASWRKAISE